MSEHTHRITTDVYSDGTTRTSVTDITDPPVEPPIDPPVISPPPTTPDLTGKVPVYVAPSGSDSAEGSEPGAPVATIERAKRRAFEIVEADPAAVVAVVAMTDGEYGEFGRLCGVNPDNAANVKDFQGADDNYFLICAYGDGARPKFSGPIDLWTHGKNVEINGVELVNSKVYSRSKWRGLRVVASLLRNSKIEVQTVVEGDRFAYLDLFDNTVRDLIAHKSKGYSGVFASSVDHIRMSRNTFTNCGRFADGGDNKYDHGAYIAGDCGPLDECEENTAVYCGGIGLQIRPGGYIRRNFSALNGWGAMDVLTFGAKTSDVASIGEFTANVCHQSAISHAIKIGNVVDFPITDNAASCDSGGALALVGDHGANSYGGARFGLSNVDVSANTLRGTKGGVFASKDGWFGPVNIHANELDGGVHRHTNFADPLGNFNEGANTAADLSALVGPVYSPELLEAIATGQITNAELREKYGAAS